MDVSAFQQQLQNMMSGGGNAMNGSMGGNMAQFEELTKALQASNYVTDVKELSQGGALGVQSLDTAMKTTIQENEHFTLFNRLAQSNAINVVDEYTRQSSVGGFLGGSTNTQMGVVRAAQGEYSREVGFVKFLMTLRQVGYVLNIGKNIAEPVAVEERNGALQLLTDANYLLYHGNADIIGTQFDGIFNQIDKEIIAGKMSEQNVKDMDGKPLNSVEPISVINSEVSSYGNWGRSTDIFLPNSVQNDFNQGLDPAFRWTPDGSNIPTVGGHVAGIRLTNGILKTNMDTFIHDETNPMTHPFEVKNTAVAKSLDKLKPTALTAKAVASNDSTFTRGKRLGTYSYAVAAISKSGAGISRVIIANGDVALDKTKSAYELEITAPNDDDIGGYAIYRAIQDVSAATAMTGDKPTAPEKDLHAFLDANYRLVKYIAKDTKNATTKWTDNNRDIPGTVCAPLLNLGAGADAIGWRQFQPMTKIPLPFGVGGMPVMSWFQFLFGYLRMTKPRHHGYIKNILPSTASWRPHPSE
ncbi:hypothetical protein CTA21_16205 [Salmonella enterica]|nr:hypothetical protein [Salmonella enterica]